MGSKACDRLRPHLVDFVVGETELSEVQTGDIEKHLAECAECRAVAEELRGTGRALEAVRTLDTRLREEVRRNITSRARVEAELVRATREHQRVVGLDAGRPVPLAAWVALGLGAAAAVILAVFVPRMLAKAPGKAAEVLATAGDGLRDRWPKGARFEDGQELSVPAECVLCLRLTDGSRLDVCGPADVRLSGPSGPLELARGLAYIEAAGPVTLRLAPLKSLMIQGGGKACLGSQPAGTPAAVVTVLSGAADYSAGGQDGRIEAGSTLEAGGAGKAPATRAMKESDRPLWRGRVTAP